MLRINGEKYKVSRYTNQTITVYYKSGILLDIIEDGDIVVGYVDFDGQGLGVVRSKKRVIVQRLLQLLLLLLVVIALITSFVILTGGEDYGSDISVPGLTPEEQLTLDNVTGKVGDTDYTLSYNQYCTYVDGKVDIRFTNVDTKTNIRLEAQNISSDIIEVEPGEIVLDINVTAAKGIEFPMRATLFVTINGKDYRCPIIINKYDEITFSPVNVKDKTEIDTEVIVR